MTTIGLAPNFIVYSKKQGRENLLNGMFNYAKRLDRDGDNLLSVKELRELPVLGSTLTPSEMDSFAKSVSMLDGQAGVSYVDLAVVLLQIETSAKTQIKSPNLSDATFTPVGQHDGVINEVELNQAVTDIRDDLALTRPFHDQNRPSGFPKVPGLSIGEDYLYNRYARIASVSTPSPFKVFQSWSAQSAEQFKQQYLQWHNEVQGVDPKQQTQQVQNDYARLGAPEIDFNRLSTDPVYAKQVLGQIETRVDQLTQTPSLQETQRQLLDAIQKADAGFVAQGYVALDLDQTGQLMAEILKPDYVKNLNDQQLLVWAQLVGNAGTLNSYGQDNGLGQFIRDHINSPDPKLARAVANAASGLQHFWGISDDFASGAYEGDPNYKNESVNIRALLKDIQFDQVKKRY